MTTDCKADASERLAAVKGDGWLALVRACEEMQALRAHVAELEEAEADWQSATMLETSAGDPDGITPNHLRRRIAEDELALAGALARATAAEARAKALEGYACHTDECAWWERHKTGVEHCTCGLAPLLEKEESCG